MDRMLRSILIAALTFTAASPLTAQWFQTTGPYTGAVFFRSERTTLYVVIPYGGLYQSSDNGSTWSGPNAGLQSFAPINCVTVLGSDMYVGSSEHQGLMRSTDKGATWTLVSSGQVYWVTYLAASGTALYASNAGRLWRSTDGGNSWAQLLTGKALSVAVVDSLNIYAMDSNLPGVYASTDGGASWNYSQAGLPGVGNLCITADRTDAYVGTVSMGVYRSSDKGVTWHLAGALLRLSRVFPVLASDSLLFAGTFTDVFSSTDKGDTWHAMQGNFQKLWFLARTPSYLFALDRTSGIWRSPIAGITALREQSAGAPAAFALEQNYPNPFNPSTTIRYSLPARSHVTLSVFNPLGQKVAELVNADIDAGYHSVEFNASNLASGVYFYRLQAGSFMEVKKMLIMK